MGTKTNFGYYFKICEGTHYLYLIYKGKLLILQEML